MVLVGKSLVGGESNLWTPGFLLGLARVILGLLLMLAGIVVLRLAATRQHAYFGDYLRAKDDPEFRILLTKTDAGDRFYGAKRGLTWALIAIGGYLLVIGSMMWVWAGA